MKNYLFSSESVTEGHPDKLCDQISDAILDAVIKDDPAGRVCCETVVKTGMVLVTGEISTSTYVDIPRVVRKVLRDVGYTDAAYGISADGCAVINTISEQSGDISQGVTVGEGLHEEQGAGDQGIMFGYATNETPEYMPLPIVLAHKLCKKLAEVRKDGTLPWVRPDGKSQVTIKYINNKPICTTAIVIAAQHNPGVDHATIKSSIIEHVIKPVCGDYLNETTKFYVNE
ncbi:MAG: S-adenosylmethionine synthetase N-terminal domain-containing protein, partial [Anaerolineales bacterium]|nr:S-adenosylmethionine synthetase N-terminal domain-containing protein [Anaerolineales bacterium]